MSRFGSELTRYCREKEIKTLSVLCNLLEEYYPTSVTTIHKYIHGKIRPPAEFIYQVSRCLELNEFESNFLLEMALYDIYYKFLTDYNKAVKSIEGKKGK